MKNNWFYVYLFFYSLFTYLLVTLTVYLMPIFWSQLVYIFHACVNENYNHKQLVIIVDRHVINRLAL